MFSIDSVLSEEEQNILILVAAHPGLKHLSNSDFRQHQMLAACCPAIIPKTIAGPIVEPGPG